MMKLCTFFLVITTGLFFFLGGGGVGSFILYIYILLGLFLEVKVKNWNIFFWGGGCYMLNIFGVCLMFLVYIFLGGGG